MTEGLVIVPDIRVYHTEGFLVTNRQLLELSSPILKTLSDKRNVDRRNLRLDLEGDKANEVILLMRYISGGGLEVNDRELEILVRLGNKYMVEGLAGESGHSLRKKSTT